MTKTPMRGGYPVMRNPLKLDDMARKDVEKLIRSANLGKINTQIANMRYIERLPLADIAAVVHLDRSTVGKRLRREIDPKLNDL